MSECVCVCVIVYFHSATQVGIFGMYLLICVAKGNFKFGARFLFINVRSPSGRTPAVI